MNPDQLKYTKDHEYIGDAGDGTYVVGISDHAQEQLGDVTFVELPDVGATFAQGDEAATVESVKAASDVYAPIGGTVAEVNDALEDQPELVNSSPYENGWFFKLKDIDAAQLDALMDAEAYAKHAEADTH